MLCNTTSIYPNGLDPMIFFHDNDIEKVEIINEYEKLIAQGKYDEANAFIENQQGIYGYFADFFNAIENRIFKLQEYLLSLPPKEQPFIYYDGDEFPLELYQSGTHLVLENEEHDVLNQFDHEELENAREINGDLQISNEDINNIIWI